MIVDSIVLAGGRSSRLGGVAKQSLVIDGSTLLERTLAALGETRLIVVVGDEAPAGMIRVRELPPFSGPTAAIGAGFAALEGALDDAALPASDIVVVLACDLPDAALLVPHLTASTAGDGTLILDGDGSPQYLAIAVRTVALGAALHRAAPLADLPVRRLLDGLDLRPVRVPVGTRDIDTWDDAESFGIPRPLSPEENP